MRGSVPRSWSRGAARELEVVAAAEGMTLTV